MQFSLRMSTILAGLLLLLSFQVVHSLSLSIARRESQYHTLPLKRVAQRSTDIHPQILLQARINRGYRQLAKMTGLEPPSAQSLEKRLEKRVLSLDPSTDINRRYNRFRHPHNVREVEPEKRFHRAGSKLRPKSREEAVAFANPPSTANSLGLDIENADDSYLATIQIGTPPQNFSILMDSGSADFWVGSEQCTTEGNRGGGCGNHAFLGPQSSSSFAATSRPFNITYGTGNVAGTVVKDNVEIAGLMLSGHTFGVANKESVGFSSSNIPSDGLMGLAKSTISAQRTPTPIESLAAAGLVQAAIVSYKISRLADGKNDGEITFGALDETKFDSKTLVTLPNVNNLGFWEADLDGVSVNGVDLGLENRTTILDTGTTLMLVPAPDAEAIRQNIPGAQSDGQGGFTVPCTTNATVALTYGGQLFTIDSRDLAVQPLDPNDPQGSCTSGIASWNLSNNLKEWLVGDVFLKNAYFSTDFSKDTLSLAKLV